MAQSSFLLRIFLMAGLSCAVCTGARTGQELFGPKLPASTVYEKLSVWRHTLTLMVDKFSAGRSTFEQCRQKAIENGAHYFSHVRRSRICKFGVLTHPLCNISTEGGEEIYVNTNFLTNGSNTDGAVLKKRKYAPFVVGKTTKGFRVENPTIIQIDGFYRELRQFRRLKPVYKELMILSNEGKVLVTSDDHLVDPSCFSTSSCAMPIFTTAVEAFSRRHVALHNVCGKTLKVGCGGKKGINVFSHEGIGCKFFPEKYPVSRCNVRIKGSRPMKVKVTLVNFKKETCDGALLSIISYSEGTSKVNNMCTENSPTEFEIPKGTVDISFSPSATQTWNKYGFIVSVSYEIR